MNKPCKLLESLKFFLNFFCGPLFVGVVRFHGKRKGAHVYMYACKARAKLFWFFPLPPLGRCAGWGYLNGMTLTLEFSGLAADSPRQRAR